MLYSKQTYGPSLTEHEPPKIVNRLRGDAGQLGEGITNGGLAHPPRRAPARQARARLIIHRATWTDPCERRLGPLAHNWHEGPAASHVAQKNSHATSRLAYVRVCVAGLVGKKFCTVSAFLGVHTPTIIVGTWACQCVPRTFHLSRRIVKLKQHEIHTGVFFVISSVDEGLCSNSLSPA